MFKGMPPISLIPLPVKAFTWRCSDALSADVCGAIVSHIVRHFVINTASAPLFNWGSASHGWQIVSSTAWRVAPRWRILWLALLAILYCRRPCFPGVLPRRSLYEDDVQ